VDTGDQTLEQSVAVLVEYLDKSGYLSA